MLIVLVSQHLSNNDINKVIGKLWRELPGEEKVLFLRQSLNDKIRYLQEVHIYNTFHGGNIIPKIDPPPGYGLDGQPLVSSCGPEKSAVPDIMGWVNKGCVSGLSDAPPTQKKRGRKKRLPEGDATQGMQDSDRPAVVRPRTAYSLFAHQVRIPDCPRLRCVTDSCCACHWVA